MKRTKEEALLTRASIMESALNLFIKHGYSQTTTNDIVKGIDATRGAFYFHFEDKEDLFKQLMNRELDFISELIVAAFIDREDERIRMEQLLLNVIDNFYLNGRFRKVIQLTWFRVEVDTDCHVMRAKTSFNEFFIEEVNKLLEKAKQKGLLKKDVKPLETSIHATAIILGIYRMYFVVPEYMRDPETSKIIARDFVKSIFN